MAEPKSEEFLDDIEVAEQEEQAVMTEEEGHAPFDEIEALRAERDDLKDKFMRALAEAENARKRSDKDRREAHQYGGSRLARDLLPVYDNLKRALDAATDEQREAAGALMEGVELTLRELMNVFSKHGIDVIAPEVGDTLIRRCIRPCSRHPFLERKLARSFRSRPRGSCYMTGCCVRLRLVCHPHRHDEGGAAPIRCRGFPRSLFG